MKIDRQIGILSVLLQKETVTAPYLAEKFEVSRRTINRDFRLFKLNRMDQVKISEQEFLFRQVPMPDLSDERVFPGGIKVSIECMKKMYEDKI